MEMKKLKEEHWLVLLVVVCSLVFYTPYLLSDSLDIVARYWDGPNYVYLAKTMYSVPQDHPLSLYTTPSYFAAHLPVYPVAIRLFSFIGYINSMLWCSFLFTALSTVCFYRLLKESGTVSDPFKSAAFSLFIPARYLIYQHVGATEPAFLFFIIFSLLQFHRKNYRYAFLLVGIASLTRITGILMAISYLIVLLCRKDYKTLPWLALAVLPLTLWFGFYYFHYGDFFAYLGVNYSESNRIFKLNPLLIFRDYAKGGHVHAAELYLNSYILYGVGLLLLWRIHKVFFWFAAVQFAFAVCIYHQDISRYLIPLAPFCLVVAYDSVIRKMPGLITLVMLGVVTHIYAWGALPHNLVDKHSWQALKKVIEPVRLNPSQPVISFYSGKNFDHPVREENVQDVDYNWMWSAPEGLPADGFSARITYAFEAKKNQNHTLLTSSDDGIRIILNGELLTDEWHNRAATETETVLPIRKGANRLIIEYFEDAATASLSAHIKHHGEKRPLSDLPNL